MTNLDNMLAGVPQFLRSMLLSTYEGILVSHAEGRWEQASLRGGKFCEIIYALLVGAITGSYPETVEKPQNMMDVCRKLENVPSSASRPSDRSLRILIPRTLPVLYEIRNNRGVGHAGGDVDANRMDSELVVSLSTWVMGELVRIYHAVSTAEAQTAVDSIVQRKIPLVWDGGGVKRVLDPALPKKDQVLVLLYQAGSWMSALTLKEYVEYSNSTVFRRSILSPLHGSRYIEFNQRDDRAIITPRGERYTEEQILRERIGLS